jgi:hypothetical protein
MQVSELVAELLGPRLTKGEARPLENQAKRHFRAAGRNLARFSADLRRLQDGEAHLTRGFSSFGAYAEHVFDGLSAANAKKISVQGAVLLALERHARIALDDQTSRLPGATGLRALGVVMSQHGEDTMLAIYDRATQLRPGRAVVDRTVNSQSTACSRHHPRSTSGPTHMARRQPPRHRASGSARSTTRSPTTTIPTRTPRPCTNCTTA